MTDAIIRPARPEDTEAMRAILNAEIWGGVNVWHETERDADEMRDWALARSAVVAEVAGAVVGYGGYGPFRPHSGYALTAEHSLYVEPGHRGRGVGAALLEALCERAQAQGMRVMIGGVEAGNAASLALHRRFGFEETGRLPDVGRKFGRWLTLVFMQRTFSS